MTADEAASITNLLEGATSSRPTAKTLEFFQAALTHLDFDIALSAVRVGTITWDYFPSWGKFKEVYRSETRLAEPVGEQRSDIYHTDNRALQHAEDLPKRGDHAPEWVHVWRWARLVRSPRNFRAFPQQHGQVDPLDLMQESDYEKLRSEWIADGSPKAKNPIPTSI